MPQWPLCCSFTSKYDLDWTRGAVASAAPDPQARVPPFIRTTWKGGGVRMGIIRMNVARELRRLWI